MRFAQDYRNVAEYLFKLEGVTWDAAQDAIPAQLPPGKAEPRKFIVEQASDLLGWMGREIVNKTERAVVIDVMVREFLVTRPPHDPESHVAMEMDEAAGGAFYTPESDFKGQPVDLMAIALRTDPEHYYVYCQRCLGQVRPVEGRWVHVELQGG